MKKSKSLTDAYIDLNVFLTPKKTRLIIESSFLPFEQVLKSTEDNIVILGDPGAGKTTSMKFICQKLLSDEMFLKGIATFPVVVRLRDLKIFTRVIKEEQKERTEEVIESLFFHIYEMLGIQIGFKGENEEKIQVINKNNYWDHLRFLKNIILPLLDDLQVLLILDGLDEVAALSKHQLIDEIKSLSLELNRTKLVITCRSGEFNYKIEKSTEYELCELSDSQIKKFIHKWIKEEEASEKIYSQILLSPFKDSLARPLTLAHLCAIYERYGRIPDKPKTLYKKIVSLLIEEWDNQNNTQRRSGYGNFDTDRKFDFLCHLSFYLTTNLQTITFTKEDFKNTYTKICQNFDLPESESAKVASEIESHTGLFLQSGYQKYEFAHKSIQEYLCAEYLVRLPQIPFDKKLLNKIPNELALATAVSSNPTHYLSNLCINLSINYVSDESFINTFFRRLYLEKPDLISEPILALAILMLLEKSNPYKYNFTYRPNANRYSQNHFENFFSSDTFINSMKMLKKYYVIRLNKDAINIKTKNVEYENEIATFLPEKLNVKNQYISSLISYELEKSAIKE